MTSVKVSDISTSPTLVQVVTHTGEGRLIKPLRGGLAQTQSDDEPIISVYYYQHVASTSGHSPDLTNCQASLLLSSAETNSKPFFHGSIILLPEEDVLYTTSDLLQTKDPDVSAVLMSRIRLTRQASSAFISDISYLEWEKLRPPPMMAFPSGATHFAKGTVFCSQGNSTPGTGGLFYLSSVQGQKPIPLVTGFHGRDFNSPHDVAVAPDDKAALWFTDPRCGFERGLRQQPDLPSRLYRFVPGFDGSRTVGGELRVMADGLRQPMGLAFSPDGRTLYVSDAGLDEDPSRTGAIYAYDVIVRGDAPFLSNKRLFAVPAWGCPDTVRCDGWGFVYAACSGGIECWNAGGTLQVIIEITGGVTSFCFGKGDNQVQEMFVCSQQRLWRLRFGVPDQEE